MTADQAVAFLEALQVTQIFVKDNGWVTGSCPLARWFHKNHVDRSPSFGLSIAPGGRSFFTCFACRQGSAEELLHSIEMYSKGTALYYDFARCHQILMDEEHVVPLPPYGEFVHATSPFIEWPQYWLESFKSVLWVAEAMAYLMSRSVSVDTIKTFSLRYDPKREMIVAPYWDVHQRFAGARGRAIKDDAPKKHHDYTFQSINNARLCWYNESVLNLHGPVVTVEGQFDCWKTVQAFPKTVAALTSKPNMEKMKKLGDCGTVIQIPDRDDAGRQSVGKYASLCQQLGLKHHVIWLDEGVEDPAQCHVDYLRDKIQEGVYA